MSVYVCMYACVIVSWRQKRSEKAQRFLVPWDALFISQGDNIQPALPVPAPGLEFLLTDFRLEIRIKSLSSKLVQVSRGLDVFS